MPAEYVIYRADTITDDESTAVYPALVRLGTTIGASAKQALVNWYVESGETDMHDFVVIPLSHHHALSPKVEAQPRLSFS